MSGKKGEKMGMNGKSAQKLSGKKGEKTLWGFPFFPVWGFFPVAGSPDHGTAQ